MKRNIVLVGFMGCGKSTLARILGEKLGWATISTDARIEEKEGRRIAEIFKDSGESYFRKLEHQTVMDIAASQGVIVDCGGGVVLNPENIKSLKKTGTVIYLSCNPKEIYRRVTMQPKRPLLDVPDPMAKIEALLKERQPLYEQADMTFDTSDGNLSWVAQEIIEKLKP